MSGLEFSPSWGFGSSVSLDGLGFLGGMVEVDCVLVDGTSVGGGVHVTRGTVGRHLPAKESGFGFFLKCGQKRRGRMARGGHKYAPYVFAKS